MTQKVLSTPYRDPMDAAVAAAALSMRKERKPAQCKGGKRCWVELGKRPLKEPQGHGGKHFSYVRCQGCGYTL